MPWWDQKRSHLTKRPVGKVFMTEYAKFIAAKNVKLGSSGQLEAVRKLIGK
jgi:fructose-bisphosphate aldolase, class II